MDDWVLKTKTITLNSTSLFTLWLSCYNVPMAMFQTTFAHSWSHIDISYNCRLACIHISGMSTIIIGYHDSNRWKKLRGNIFRWLTSRIKTSCHVDDTQGKMRQYFTPWSWTDIGPKIPGLCLLLLNQLIRRTLILTNRKTNEGWINTTNSLYPRKQYFLTQ